MQNCELLGLFGICHSGWMVGGHGTGVAGVRSWTSKENPPEYLATVRQLIDLLIYGEMS